MKTLKIENDMKKSCLLVFLVFLAQFSFCQIRKTKTIPSITKKELPLSVSMMIGGGSLITAGLLTSPVYVGGSTTKKESGYKQLHKILPITSGSIIFCIGIKLSIK